MSYSIGEVSAKTGLTAPTIRYYEKEGVLPHIKRNNKGIREFNDDNIFWIDLIRCLRGTDMSINDIKSIVDLSLEGEHTVEKRKVILQNHKKKIWSQIDELLEIIAKIDRKIDNCGSCCKKK
ncbi:MAG: MerR family transcriptional regulator [Vallitalea sp.]|nr:MerR family transcriptional regulator [Vallitalea sp.]